MLTQAQHVCSALHVRPNVLQTPGSPQQVMRHHALQASTCCKACPLLLASGPASSTTS